MLNPDGSIRVLQIKQLIKPTGRLLAQIANKQERANRLDAYRAQIKGNHCIFTNENVPTWTAPIKIIR